MLRGTKTKNTKNCSLPLPPVPFGHTPRGSAGENTKINIKLFNTKKGYLMTKELYDFSTELRPMVTCNGEKIPERMAVVRTDTNTVLGIVGKDYKVVFP